MQPEMIIALILALPISFLMIAFICYLNGGRFCTAVKSFLSRKHTATGTSSRYLSKKIPVVVPVEHD